MATVHTNEASFPSSTVSGHWTVDEEGVFYHTWNASQLHCHWGVGEGPWSKGTTPRYSRTMWRDSAAISSCNSQLFIPYQTRDTVAPAQGGTEKRWGPDDPWCQLLIVLSSLNTFHHLISVQSLSWRSWMSDYENIPAWYNRGNLFLHAFTGKYWFLIA